MSAQRRAHAPALQHAAEQRHRARVRVTRRCGFAAGGVFSSDLITSSALGSLSRVCSRFIERRQDAAHSFLVMCVPASQKPMHASKVSAPPPGVLGADWLGLGLVPIIPVVGDPPPPGKVGVTPTPGVVVESPPGAVVVAPPPGAAGMPPLPRKVVVVCGVSGATGATCGDGVPTADGGIAPVGAGAGLGGGEASDRPEANPPLLAAAAAPPPRL